MTEPKPDYIVRLEAEEAKRAERQETLDELRGWLDGKHRDALKEEPYGQFVSKVPVSLLAKLTPQEIEQLDAFEQQAFGRHRQLAQTKEQQRTACLAAGGDAEGFEVYWESYGKDAHAAQATEESLERARREGNVFDQRKVSAP